MEITCKSFDLNDNRKKNKSDFRMPDSHLQSISDVDDNFFVVLSFKLRAEREHFYQGQNQDIFEIIRYIF